MKHASLAKVWQSFSPKFQVPNMHYWLKFADVSVAPNFECQICIISGLKFDWCLSAYIWVKPDCLIEELFYLMWGERLVPSRQCGGNKHITRPAEAVCSWLWPWQLQPFWQPLQADKLWVTISTYVSVVWSWMFSRGMKAPMAMAPWLPGCSLTCLTGFPSCSL